MTQLYLRKGFQVLLESASGLSSAGPAVIVERPTTYLRWRGYILALLIPLGGLITGIYIVVSKRGESIRRHGWGIIALSVVSAAIWGFSLAAVISANAGANAATDLKGLLDSHNIAYSGVQCAHQSGSQFACIVTAADGTTQSLQVTDDGHEIITSQ